MLEPTPIAIHTTQADRWRSRLSLAGLILAITLLAAALLLMSPPREASYPGAQPWSPHSLLRALVWAMSLGGSVATARGVEIKDFALHLATTLALILLALRAAISGLYPPNYRAARGAWFLGQVLLVGWVLLSAASAAWSHDAQLSLGQAALYGFGVAWAVALSWWLEGRDVPRLLWGYVVVASLGSVLCIWYFNERNWSHRPGFPLGNPSVLAACVLPALLIVAATLASSIREMLRGKRRWDYRAAIAAGVLLVPLAACFRLAGSRAAWLGLFAGVACVAFVLARRRLRWIISAVLGLCVIAGGWYATTASHDLTMGRGASMRFRSYAWRYAAELWSRRPISGTGAGSYPRFAGWRAVEDRALDPAAFMGDVVEHAHNELFEVLAEIGLVGGLTFVGGFVATLAAAASLLRTSLSAQRRALLIGLLAGMYALLVDSLFGVGLRLPGLPAVFFTLLGALWSWCRSVSKSRPAERRPPAWLGLMVTRRYVVAGAAAGLALLGGGLALRNWSGVLADHDARLAASHGDYATAQPLIARAAGRMLDPVRVLLARERGVFYKLQSAGAEFKRYEALTHTESTTPDELEAARVRARELSAGTYLATQELVAQTPAFFSRASLGARAAEMLSVLTQADGDEDSRRWVARAQLAWQVQRDQRPFDVEALLALTRYPEFTTKAQIGDYVGLLRDALRAGFPSAAWLARFNVVAQRDDFQAALVALVQSIGPMHPETDPDALIQSRAPEMYRLAAIWHDQRRQWRLAAMLAERAAQLYEPLRSRVPELYSVARAEQADYEFLADPHGSRKAVELLLDAIRALPKIQVQKARAMVRPYRIRLARYLLASGLESDARRELASVSEDEKAVSRALSSLYVELTRRVVRLPKPNRPDVNAWLDSARRITPGYFQAWAWQAWYAAEGEGATGVEAVLTRAQAELTDEQIGQIRQSLCQQFPALCEALSTSD